MIVKDIKETYFKKRVGGRKHMLIFCPIWVMQSAPHYCFFYPHSESFFLLFRHYYSNEGYIEVLLLILKVQESYKFPSQESSRYF